jgi:hypothetical protein
MNMLCKLFILIITINGCSKNPKNSRIKGENKIRNSEFTQSYLSKDGSNFFDFPRKDSAPNIFQY